MAPDPDGNQEKVRLFFQSDFDIDRFFDAKDGIVKMTKENFSSQLSNKIGTGNNSVKKNKANQIRLYIAQELIKDLEFGDKAKVVQRNKSKDIVNDLWIPIV